MNEARTEEPFIRKFKNREEVSIDFEVFTNLTKNFKIFSKKTINYFRKDLSHLRSFLLSPYKTFGEIP